MGGCKVKAELAETSKQQYEPVELTVDTGSSHTSLPGSLLRRLGVKPHGRKRFVIADGRRIDSDFGGAWIRLNGHEEVTIVVFAEEGTEPLLGAITLDEFGLGVDPLAHELVAVEKYRLTRIRADD